MSAVRNDRTAAARVDYRLTYAREEEPRRCHLFGIDGEDLPNAYWGRGIVPASEDAETGSGSWDDPEHPGPEAPEEEHIARWFQTAVREAIHEALEWFWVDNAIYLNPHGLDEDKIHKLSEEFTERLLAVRNGTAS